MILGSSVKNSALAAVGSTASTATGSSAAQGYVTTLAATVTYGPANFLLRLLDQVEAWSTRSALPTKILVSSLIVGSAAGIFAQYVSRSVFKKNIWNMIDTKHRTECSTLPDSKAYSDGRSDGLKRGDLLHAAPLYGWIKYTALTPLDRLKQALIVRHPSADGMIRWLKLSKPAATKLPVSFELASQISDRAVMRPDASVEEAYSRIIDACTRTTGVNIDRRFMTQGTDYFAGSEALALSMWLDSKRKSRKFPFPARLLR